MPNSRKPKVPSPAAPASNRDDRAMEEASDHVMTVVHTSPPRNRPLGDYSQGIEGYSLDNIAIIENPGDVRPPQSSLSPSGGTHPPLPPFLTVEEDCPLAPAEDRRQSSDRRHSREEQQSAQAAADVERLKQQVTKAVEFLEQQEQQSTQAAEIYDQPGRTKAAEIYEQLRQHLTKAAETYEQLKQQSSEAAEIFDKQATTQAAEIYEQQESNQAAEILAQLGQQLAQEAAIFEQQEQQTIQEALTFNQRSPQLASSRSPQLASSSRAFPPKIVIPDCLLEELSVRGASVPEQLLVPGPESESLLPESETPRRSSAPPHAEQRNIRSPREAVTPALPPARMSKKRTRPSSMKAPKAPAQLLSPVYPAGEGPKEPPPWISPAPRLRVIRPKRATSDPRPISETQAFISRVAAEQDTEEEVIARPKREPSPMQVPSRRVTAPAPSRSRGPAGEEEVIARPKRELSPRQVPSRRVTAPAPELSPRQVPSRWATAPAPSRSRVPALTVQPLVEPLAEPELAGPLLPELETALTGPLLEEFTDTSSASVEPPPFPESALGGPSAPESAALADLPEPLHTSPALPQQMATPVVPTCLAAELSPHLSPPSLEEDERELVSPLFSELLGLAGGPRLTQLLLPPAALPVSVPSKPLPFSEFATEEPLPGPSAEPLLEPMLEPMPLEPPLPSPPRPEEDESAAAARAAADSEALASLARLTKTTAGRQPLDIDLLAKTRARRFPLKLEPLKKLPPVGAAFTQYPEKLIQRAAAEEAEEAEKTAAEEAEAAEKATAAKEEKKDEKKKKKDEEEEDEPFIRELREQLEALCEAVQGIPPTVSQRAMLARFLHPEDRKKLPPRVPLRESALSSGPRRRPASSSDPRREGTATASSSSSGAAQEEEVAAGVLNEPQRELPPAPSPYEVAHQTMPEDFIAALVRFQIPRWPRFVGSYIVPRILITCLELTRIFDDRFRRQLQTTVVPISQKWFRSKHLWTGPKLELPWGKQWVDCRELKHVRRTNVMAPLVEELIYRPVQYCAQRHTEDIYYGKVLFFEQEYAPLHIGLHWVKDHALRCPRRVFLGDEPRVPYILQEMYGRVDNDCECSFEPVTSFSVRPHSRRVFPKGIPFNASVPAGGRDWAAPYTRKRCTGEVVRTQWIAPRDIRSPQIIVFLGGRDNTAFDFLDHGALMYDACMDLAREYGVRAGGRRARENAWECLVNFLFVDCPGYGASRGNPALQSHLDAAVEAVREEVALFESHETVELHIFAYSTAASVALRLARLAAEARALRSRGRLGKERTQFDFNDAELSKCVINTIILVAPVASVGGLVVDRVICKDDEGEFEGKTVLANSHMDAKRDLQDFLNICVAHHRQFDELMLGFLAAKVDPLCADARAMYQVAEDIHRAHPPIVPYYKALPTDHHSIFQAHGTIGLLRALFPMEEWFSFGVDPCYFLPPKDVAERR